MHRRLAQAASMLHNRCTCGEGDEELATRRAAVRAGALAAGAMSWPPTASAAAAGAGAGALLVAVVVGGAIAIAASVVATRVRERRAAEANRQALAAACAFWWRTDAAGRVVEIQPGRAPAGASVDALRGRLLWEPLPGGPPIGPVHTAFTSVQPFAGIAYPLSNPHGPVVALSGGPVHSDAGTLLGFTGIAAALAGDGVASSDELKALQRELDDSWRQLGDRSRELDHAVRELDSFAYSVSHDLRAPLRIVDGFAAIVLEDYGDRGKPLDDVGRDHLRRIVSASQRMNTMIDTLLGLSQMTSRELARERIDLSQIARELVDDLRAHDPGRAVEVSVAPGLRTDGDATLLRLVLQNLLGNAWKFTARTRDARIEFGARQDGGGLAYYVKDNGAGFDMRFAEKMFGLFQRLHSANEFPGTGVGLATVQKIVRRHGGRVWAEAIPAPDEGHGATFFFTLWEKS
jgi:signal transduction histidine kinase